MSADKPEILPASPESPVSTADSPLDSAKPTTPLAIQPAPAPASVSYENAVVIMPPPAKSKKKAQGKEDDWNKVVEEYYNSKYFKKLSKTSGSQQQEAGADDKSFEALSGKAGSGKTERDRQILRFESEKDAKDFFQEMADKNLTFAVKELDGRGKPTGNYKVSLGDGQLIEGKLKNPAHLKHLKQTYDSWLNATDETEKAKFKDQLVNFEKTYNNPRSAVTMQAGGGASKDDTTRMKAQLEDTKSQANTPKSKDHDTGVDADADVTPEPTRPALK